MSFSAGLRFALLPALSLALTALAGCAAETLDADDEPECLDDRDCAIGLVCESGLCLPPGTDPTDPTDPGDRMYCDDASDCPEEYTCEERGAVRICIPPEVEGPDCGDCPFPGECRDGVCVMPDDEGAFCEFDPECGEGMLCIAGRCTPDPRIPRTCLDGEECPDGLMCTMDGRCVCTRTADCPVGTICSPEGECVPDDDGCIADDECPAGMLCDRGVCIPGDACDTVHPDLSTPREWEVSSVYNLREALPGWLDDFLDAVSGPFRFLAGDSDDPDLGLPGFIEGAIGAAIRGWAEDNLPPWALRAMGGVADLNDILSTWLVQEIMRLTPGEERDAYRGESEWIEVTFEYRGDRLTGRPEDIIDWSYDPDTFDAQAVCGTFNVERHDVNVGIGAIISWAVDAVVFEASDGRYTGLRDMADTLRMNLCGEAGRIATRVCNDLADSILCAGVGSGAESWCNSSVESLLDVALSAVEEARLRLDVMRLGGYATIVSGTRLEPGVWEGSLVGGDFTGSWSARR